ncbi:(Fe-S)-binding protein [candidate division CSSED10-310 bacterium]|uniref:(Fe-S)-binding protein n=1 Tax=candidate division CSSED10-310 bacterium TaxID=2855610 RepID=A0ABV6Z475_UNCC1
MKQSLLQQAEVFQDPITLFVPCLVDQFFPEVAISTLKILKFLGYNVIYPSKQTCCGQPAFNAGYREEASKLAQHFLTTFKDAGIIVCPSGSCVGMVRYHYQTLTLPEKYQKIHQALKENIFEFSEFLFQQRVSAAITGSFPYTVNYHHSCHSLRELGLKEEPLSILRNLHDINLIEIPQAQEECCGFGGTFSVSFPALATAMVYQKVRALADTNADFVVANDVSCLMHLEGALHRLQKKIVPLHLATLLTRAMHLD